MRVINSESYKGSRNYNGDIYGMDKNLYYVCDGSTAVFDDYKFFETGDLYEYMQLLKKNIKDSDRIENSFKEAIRLSNKDIPNLNNYQEWELPTYTIGAIKECDDRLEYFILCDILISVLYKDGHVENIEDRRLDPIKEVCRGRKRELIHDETLTEEERKKLLLENEQITRMKANQEGTGFFVGSTKEGSIDAGYNGVLKKDEIDRILICSDGFYDSEDEMPSKREDFLEENIKTRVNEKINHEKRDDLTYLLLEV